MSFSFLFFFFIFYQVLEVQKEEGLRTIEKLEIEVFGLHEQLENEMRFDLALTTGAGRGRPKSGPFVSYVRCLLGTGLLSPLNLLSTSPLVTDRPVSFHP